MLKKSLKIHTVGLNCCAFANNDNFFKGSLFCGYLDMNACNRGTAGCSQICNNTLGSYICSCNSGYTLDADNHTCNGEGHIAEFLSFILVLCRHQ